MYGGNTNYHVNPYIQGTTVPCDNVPIATYVYHISGGLMPTILPDSHTNYNVPTVFFLNLPRLRVLSLMETLLINYHRVRSYPVYRDCYGVLYSPHTLGNSLLTFIFKSF